MKYSALYKTLLFNAAIFGAKAQSIDFQTQYMETGTAQDKSTNTISPEDDLFSQCTCDLTPGGCDYRCCCDTDCAEDTITAWKLKSNYCIDEVQENKVVNMSDCMARTRDPSINDLQDGLLIYEKTARSLLCNSFNSPRSETSNFISEQFQADSIEEYDALKQEEINLTNSYIYTHPVPEETTFTESGYQPNERLIGFKSTASGEQYSQKDKVLYSRQGIYGHCDKRIESQFMVNLDIDQCFISRDRISQATCDSLSYENSSKYEYDPKDNARAGQTITVNGEDIVIPDYIQQTPGKQKKFSLNDFSEIDLGLPTTFTETSTYDEDACSCDNFVLEAHYKVYFKENVNSDDQIIGNSYKIDRVDVDVVYGTWTSCTEDFTATLKTSLTFLETVESKLNAGNPGYMIGQPLQIGTTAIYQENLPSGAISSVPHATTSVYGFTLRGGDNQGMCYNVSEAISNDEVLQNPDDYLIQDYKQKMYFDDPVLTFEDSFVYGCNVELTYDELKYFCETRGWNNLMLFQNMYLMELIGKFGSSDHHFVQDWITLELDTGKDKYEELGTWNPAEGSCFFASVHVVEIFYKKIGKVTDPQFVIMKAQHYQAKQNKWQFTKPDRTQKESFQPLLNIQFYDVEQEPILFTPSNAKIISPVKRNILYPFYVYGSNNPEEN